ncbi:hypothetical protein Golomagni_04175 [Golovinomyces magnicellulatus]|nr:hypothetical protein Golomagni_04175 [Golovinomyces magnicellulatus]
MAFNKLSEKIGFSCFQETPLSINLYTPSRSKDIMNKEEEIITCHVLDTKTGVPAVGMDVALSCSISPSVKFIGKTDNDGRISRWKNIQGADGAESSYVLENCGVSATIKYMIHTYTVLHKRTDKSAASSIWKLNFDTGSYYGVDNTFFPEVELSFSVREGEKYRVPLLLGPFSYTTYRGS